MNSAPEYWTFCTKDAIRIDENTFLFSVKDKHSNNGTVFTTGKVQIKMLLDFGCVEQVGVNSIISVTNMND